MGPDPDAMAKTTNGGADLFFCKYSSTEGFLVTAVPQFPINTNEKLDLSQNYPNPFSSVTTIKYSISSADHVLLRIYDVSGYEVATLVNKQQNPGNFKITFNAASLKAGTYFFKLTVGPLSVTRKLLLLK